MFTNTTRYIFIVVSIGLGLYFATNNTLGWVPLLLGCIFIVIGMFRAGPMWLAYQTYRYRRFEQMGRYLQQVHKPEWLSHKHLANYHLMSGVFAMENDNEEAAIAALEKALALGLTKDNDKAIANIFLATLQFDSLQPERITPYIEAAKALPHSERVGQLIKRLERKVNATDA
jgi:hypothetical protein